MSAPRALAIVGLLVLGLLALPLLAAVFDGEGTENLIIPLDLVVMAAVGAFVWQALPAAPPGPRTLVVGAGVGVVAALFGMLVFFFLLSGFGGA